MESFEKWAGILQFAVNLKNKYLYVDQSESSVAYSLDACVGTISLGYFVIGSGWGVINWVLVKPGNLKSMRHNPHMHKFVS